MKRMRMVTTCISVREDVLEAMRKLAELKRAQRGGLGRASVSATLAEVALAELAREEKRKGRRDA